MLWSKQKERKQQEMKADKDMSELKNHTFRPEMVSKQFNVAAIAQPIFQHRKQAESYSEIHKNKFRAVTPNKQDMQSTITPRTHNCMHKSFVPIMPTPKKNQSTTSPFKKEIPTAFISLTVHKSNSPKRN